MKHRLFIVTSILIVLFTVLLSRLADVQIFRGADFLVQAERNRWHEVSTVPTRGVIVDRFNEPVVTNDRFYTRLEKPDQVYSAQTPIAREEALSLLATDSAAVRKQTTRYYPYGSALAHIVGYVAGVSQEDVAADRSLQTFGVVGKTGLEAAFERQLRGQLGKERYEVDALVRRQRQVGLVPAQTGETIETTIDPIVSEVAYRALGEQRGVVAISDVASGEILALVSKPAYDPNVFSRNNPLFENEIRSQSSAQIQSWLLDEHQPFFARAVAGQYPPGSIFKIVTALAGLQSGAITPDTVVLDEGVLKVGDFSYANWYWTQYGRTEGDVNLVKALARSNDIYFYKAAEWIGPNRLAGLSRLFGLGSPVGIEIAGERSGLVPDPAWKQSVVGEPWYLGNTYHYGIGQGDVKTTPLQLLQVNQAFGNHGSMCRPHLLKTDSIACQDLGLEAEGIEVVLQGMLQACSPGGTGFPFFERNAAVYAQIGISSTNTQVASNDVFARGGVACKTGTAEFGGQDARGYRKTHGLWSGIFEPQLASNIDLGSAETNSVNEVLLPEIPIDQISDEALFAVWQQRVLQLKEQGQSYPKRLAILVIVESDEQTPYKEGSRDAAPVGLQVIEWMEQEILAGETGNLSETEVTVQEIEENGASEFGDELNVSTLSDLSDTLTE